MTVPALNGIHHVKVHVSDPRVSARWYQRVLGYEPTSEFMENGRLVGYGMEHGEGGTLLTLRLDPAFAGRTSKGVFFEMGVHGKEGLEALVEHLDAVQEPHGPVVRTPIGWVLPGLCDPDGHQMRFYVSDSEQQPDVQRPQRVHDAGTDQARLEPVVTIDLGSDGNA